MHQAGHISDAQLQTYYQQYAQFLPPLDDDDASGGDEEGEYAEGDEEGEFEGEFEGDGDDGGDDHYQPTHPQEQGNGGYSYSR